MTVTSIRLQADLEGPLKTAAERHQRSKNRAVNKAVREYFQRDALEQRHWRETEEALESARSGRIVAGEVVHEWLDSWGDETEKAPPKP
jgi:predicted transcriptional regulator